MKVKVLQAIGVVSVLSLLVFGITAWAQDPAGAEETGQISVTGEAEIRVVPDEVILTLGVETWDKNMGIAKGQNDAIVARVVALADEHDIAPEHVQTDYVNIEPRYRNGYYDERDFVGYFVHKTMVITLRDLDKFEALLADALEAGVNYVHGIQFRTTELRRHRDEARALAIRAAQEKAEALAGELGQGVGDPKMIQEVQSGWWSGYNSWWGSRWGNGMTQNVIQEMGTGALTGDGSLAPGQINVTARVSVTFQLTK
ncbi:MAG: DUF541 domain-containing protein [Anaerolineae bacterium]|nr:DUF541 domain-containing protein [Anaerolineae bacterium]